MSFPPALGLLRTLFAATLYGLTGLAALALAVPPGYACPIFPAAGVALAFMLVWGRSIALSVLVGAGFVNWWLTADRGIAGPAEWWLPLVIALGAVAQAWTGRALVTRFVRQPLLLDEPHDILRFMLLAGPVSALVSASVATPALAAAGAIGAGQWLVTWLTWWGGDLLGTVLAAPAMLCLVGRPREAWRARRLSVALPLVTGTLLLVFATRQVAIEVQHRNTERFDREAGEVLDRIQLRMRTHLDALEAMSGLFVGSGEVDAEEFRRVAEPWLKRLPALSAIGWHERVERRDLERFERQVREGGRPGFHVFNHANASDVRALARDDEVIAMRYVEPLAGNESALGVNLLSVPAARAAMELARHTDEPVASRSFALTQASDRASGTVVYKAVRRLDAAGTLQGAVFLTLRADRAYEALVGDAPPHLTVCLTDDDPLAATPRLAGPVGCERHDEGRAAHRDLHARVSFGTRPFTVRISTDIAGTAGLAGTWVLTMLGLGATAMLGALLLATTGRARRFEAEVATRTAQLEHELEERTRAEASARRNEQRFGDIFDAVPIGVRFTDLQGRLMQANPAYCQLTGYSLEELRHLDVFDLTHPDDRTDDRPMFDRLVRGEVGAYERQKRYVTKQGEVRWVRVQVRLSPDASGRAEHTVGVVEDITEHLRLLEAEQARDSAEAASRAKSDFLSRMSHELRTPLNAMLGFAQLMRMQDSERLNPRQRQWIEKTEQAGWHLLAMINDVLDLSRIEAGHLRLQIERLDLAEILRATLALVEPQAVRRELHTSTDIAADATAVQGDATRVKQILTNMLTNAIKYNRDGGQVRVGARVGTHGMVEVEVVDTGIGMNAAQLESLFQPFNRLGREMGPVEGTGIGLVISQRLAEMMGGALRVDSREGVGTSITLALPAAMAPQPVVSNTSPDAFASTGYHHRQVYYIEDNEINAEVMRAILHQRPQVRLQVFGNGLDGLAAVRHQHPDLILLDMHLPDIDGLALLQHLQADPETASIPVVAVSADAMEDQISAVLSAGALRYLTKPLSVAEVLATVDDLMARTDTVFG